MRDRRLLAVAAVDHPGGAEIGLARLLRRLAARGWEVTLTTPAGAGLPGAGAARTAALPVGGLARGTGARALRSWPRARRLARSADVAYLNGTVAGRLLPAVRGARTVLHVHDLVDRVPRFWRAADVVLADSAARWRGGWTASTPRSSTSRWSSTRRRSPRRGRRAPDRWWGSWGAWSPARARWTWSAPPPRSARGRPGPASWWWATTPTAPTRPTPPRCARAPRSSTTAWVARRRRAHAPSRRAGGAFGAASPRARSCSRPWRRGRPWWPPGWTACPRWWPTGRPACWWRRARPRSWRRPCCGSSPTASAMGAAAALHARRFSADAYADRVEALLCVRVAFDSRPAADPRGIGRYTRSLLAALRELGAGEVVESRRPDGADVFHSPWIDGALLRPTCPMVVTLHDLVPLKRPGDYLRTGLRFRLRYLAVRRAARVIVPTRTVAEDARGRLGIPSERLAVIHEAPAPTFSAAPGGRGPGGPRALPACRRTTCSGWAAWSTPTPASAWRRWPPRRGPCRWCWWARPAGGRTSCPA